MRLVPTLNEVKGEGTQRSNLNLSTTILAPAIIGGKPSKPGARPAESGCLRLLYATLITASQSWKGVRMRPDIWLETELLRREAFGGGNRTVEEELLVV